MGRAITLTAAALSALAAAVSTGCAGASSPASSRAPAPATAAGGDAARDIERLASPSFVERSRAAERLVARGEEVLPVLGAVGERPVAVGGGVPVSTTRPVVRAILAAVPDERLAAHLDSPHALVRREAAEETGTRGRWGVIPRLIERLEDPDEGVRSAAHASLRRITNQSLDYRACAPVRWRAAAAGRWRTWWNLEGHVRADREARPRST